MHPFELIRGKINCRLMKKEKKQSREREGGTRKTKKTCIICIRPKKKERKNLVLELHLYAPSEVIKQEAALLDPEVAERGFSLSKQALIKTQRPENCTEVHRPGLGGVHLIAAQECIFPPYFLGST